MALTFNIIASATVSTGVNNIDFNSIPQTYTDLVVLFTARSSAADANVMMRFNGSTTGYSQRRIYSDGSSLINGGSYGESVGVGNQSTENTGAFGITRAYIPNYTNSAYKCFLSESAAENNTTTAYQIQFGGMWSNSAAITSISLVMGSNNNFVTNSTAYLYGVLKA